jgi:hypothetical protein
MHLQVACTLDHRSGHEYQPGAHYPKTLKCFWMSPLLLSHMWPHPGVSHSPPDCPYRCKHQDNSRVPRSQNLGTLSARRAWNASEQGGLEIERASEALAAVWHAEHRTSLHSFQHLCSRKAPSKAAVCLRRCLCIVQAQSSGAHITQRRSCSSTTGVSA